MATIVNFRALSITITGGTADLYFQKNRFVASANDRTATYCLPPKSVIVEDGAVAYIHFQPNRPPTKAIGPLQINEELLQTMMKIAGPGC